MGQKVHPNGIRLVLSNLGTLLGMRIPKNSLTTWTATLKFVNS